jgi:chloramphenicol 3-O phosphotransferase
MDTSSRPGHAGRVIVLNGTSSAGKTTLARAFRDRRAVAGECWLLLALDDFNDQLPHQWFAAGHHRGPFSADGVRFAHTPHGVTVEVGDVGRSLFATYRRTAALWARQGFDVLVDDVCIDEEAARDWDEALAGLEVTWVAVRCPPGVAEERERARGDRLPGLARGMGGAVANRSRYDLELDTEAVGVEALVDRLESALGSTSRGCP